MCPVKDRGQSQVGTALSLTEAGPCAAWSIDTLQTCDFGDSVHNRNSTSAVVSNQWVARKNVCNKVKQEYSTVHFRRDQSSLKVWIGTSTHAFLHKAGKKMN